MVWNRIRIKTPQEIEKMRQAGRIVRQVLTRLGEMVAPGMTTGELDREAERLCHSMGAQCLFKGVPGRGKAGPFPGNICASINEQLVHGIPGRAALRDGDIISVDFGVRLNSWCGDAAMTYCVGQVRPEVAHLVDVTRRTLDMAIALAAPGERWSSVARTMQRYVEGENYSVVRDFVGHGIGTSMWEDPKVPNFFSRELEAHDILLEPGMVLAVEPMVNMGSPHVKYAADGWTVVTKDGLACAHFEHTIAITRSGVDVLTI